MGKAIGSIFGGAKAPKPPPPPPPPPKDDSAAVEAAAKDQRIRAAAGDRASTMLTGGEGVEEGVETAKKKLLGA